MTDAEKIDAAVDLVWQVRRDRWNEHGEELDRIANELARLVPYLNAMAVDKL